MDYLFVSGQRLGGIGADPAAQLVTTRVRKPDALVVGDDHELHMGTLLDS
ncbi:hypothetical protein NIIDMKKI_32860 [Mycobacterium kansasii]|uniref:Uncharacterized protein n=1 Tax=Mycobacterium kansasii TaxID=1768 RepID=A0A7G1IB62_MYCKA|nr:hypothetical protein NIIDMKKI_32860 [Mycobacterium kansasii]